MVFREFKVELLDRMERRLVQLLEAKVDLSSVLVAHVSRLHD